MYIDTLMCEKIIDYFNRLVFIPVKKVGFLATGCRRHGPKTTQKCQKLKTKKRSSGW